MLVVEVVLMLSLIVEDNVCCVVVFDVVIWFDCMILFVFVLVVLNVRMLVVEVLNVVVMW